MNRLEALAKLRDIERRIDRWNTLFLHTTDADWAAHDRWLYAQRDAAKRELARATDDIPAPPAIV